MKLKHSAVYTGVHREIWYAIGVTEAIYKRHGFDLVVTSLNDSHTTGLHPVGLGVDCRTRNIPLSTSEIIYQEIKQHLDPLGYDVILHREGEKRIVNGVEVPVTPHLHIEYDPKGTEYWIARVD